MAVKSAERVFRIFELLEQSPEGLTNKEVSSLLGFAPSSTLALLQTMEENGYLSADEQKRYYLGGRLMSLGAVAASRIDLNKIGTPYLKKLMQTVEETCFLGVLSGDEIVYIAKENCERTITTNASIGSRKPVYCTGLGKAFLAFLPVQIIWKKPHLRRTVRNQIHVLLRVDDLVILIIFLEHIQPRCPLECQRMYGQIVRCKLCHLLHRPAHIVQCLFWKSHDQIHVDIVKPEFSCHVKTLHRLLHRVMSADQL